MGNSYYQKQGLYDPSFEHDACGIGFVCDIMGKKSHQTIEDALQILKNLTHRGGVGSEPDTGDGAGILLQISHPFFEKVCANENIPLPDAGAYGIGMFFASPDRETMELSIRKFSAIVENEGLHVLGVRPVPVYGQCIGRTAREAQPSIAQIFIGYGGSVMAQEAFERKLFIIAKQAEKQILNCDANEADPYFYIASLSSKTIVYKGMLTPEQVDSFYIDLKDLDMQTAIALVHSRFSTNTFPSWERAHPNRYIIHNGEINTIRGNVNWSNARASMLQSSLFGGDLEKVLPIVNDNGSDSAMLDNYIQMLVMSGIPLVQAVMMAIPEPWEKDDSISPEKRAFYEYNSCLMEPWDGPAAIAFTDGSLVGATLDRNGLRPARYYVTKNNKVILSSEVGVLPLPQEDIIKKGMLGPGAMLIVDTKKQQILDDTAVKHNIATQKPYLQWLEENLLSIDELPVVPGNEKPPALPLLTRQKLFGYTWEDINLTLKGILEQGEDPVTAMGTDIPIAVLSEKPQLLYNYFKQLFAQVTNPPIDAIREKIVTSTQVYLGSESNFLEPGSKNCRRIRCQSPILNSRQLSGLKKAKGFKSKVLSILFPSGITLGLEKQLELLFQEADEAIAKGCSLIILSDRLADEENAPIPALLAASGLHHHLIRNKTRMKASIILESGEPREVHHFAALLGYGVNAIHPYLAIETAKAISESHMAAQSGSVEAAEQAYIQAVTNGLIKIMSKMGISTVQSYQGAQIFEALGIHEQVVRRFFTGTVTRIGGIGLSEIEQEALLRHSQAFDPVTKTKNHALETGGDYKWRKDGEYHMFNPQSVILLQEACRTGDYKLYQQFAALMDKESEKLCHIRGLLDIRTVDKPIAMDKIEPVESIVKRFKTGAMSYGSISQEAHECMAVAMNRLGGKSNSGEGGELPERFLPDKNGDSRCSAIKQVASGRFGVDIYYLQNAVEIQIKIAQGAKPGEGGHLPGNKVYPWIAKSRRSTPGVSLISPPPHHDIYSIEDLAQLIHDLKNANPDARISVKLVSEAGVGTIAVGVAKGLADVILVSGYDGGTGAAPRTSIRHTGLPWELGIAETHQALLMNNLRNRVVLETDGKLLTGRDVAVAALLGAEEFGFATAPLIIMGCLMMRVCNLDTCPVGIATQNPALRQNFQGKPEYIENYMRFVAQDLREWMAKIGVHKVNELVGHVERLRPKSLKSYWKASHVDLNNLLYQPEISGDESKRYFNIPQNHHLEKTMDMNTLLQICRPALKHGRKVTYKLPIHNTDRTAGTILSGKIAQQYGPDGLPEDTITLQFTGSAGQSFGAYLIRGITASLEGDCNDYVGKGLAGGKLILSPDSRFSGNPQENVIAGNVALYGATSGEAYFNGIAGERFAVRNSGANCVVEGIGNHGCEYMTGGKVIILGATGRNFAAGMSGGVAYIYNPGAQFDKNCNLSLVELDQLSEADEQFVHKMLQRHHLYTNSHKADAILSGWENERHCFIKVIPVQYKQITEAIEGFISQGVTIDNATQKAFDEYYKKPAQGRKQHG